MTEIILAIDSNDEPSIQLAWEYRRNLIYPIMTNKGFSFIHAEGVYAKRWFVRMNAVKPEVVYMTGVGHGSPHEYTGQNRMPIFKKGRYLTKEVQNKVVHFLSCYTARILGPNFVRHGCKAFFGYSQAFIVWDRRYKEVYFRCDSEIDIAFAEGNTASQVHQRTVNLFKYLIEKFIIDGKYVVAAALQHNLECLCSPVTSPDWGDKEATIYNSNR
jgi:hypothetical protein